MPSEFGKGAATFVHTDVGSERSADRLKRQVLKSCGKIDIVINNATITSMGAVKDVPISQWDTSYEVNLRGPVLLTQAFLPGMLERDYGVFVCVSSVGEAYMGAYETFKAAQVHLASTLDAELDGTGVHVFTIDWRIHPHHNPPPHRGRAERIHYVIERMDLSPSLCSTGTSL